MRLRYLPRPPPLSAWVEEGEHRLKLVTEYYRIITSRGLSHSGERTLQGSIMPPSTSHIDGVFSVTVKNQEYMPAVAALWSLVPFDFFVKSTGKSDFRLDTAKRIAIPKYVLGNSEINSRIMTLVCFTSHYAELWQSNWQDGFQQQHWSADNSVPETALMRDFFAKLTPD